MRAILMVVAHMLCHQPLQMPLVQDNHSDPASLVDSFPPHAQFCHGLRKAVRTGCVYVSNSELAEPPPRQSAIYCCAMADERTPPPPPPPQWWVTYMVAFGVSVAVGLAPLLGVLKIPLFTPLLSLITDSLRGSLIGVTSALMGLIAVGVQWYSEEQLTRDRRRRALFASLCIAFIAAISFYVVTTYVVKEVPFGGHKDREVGSFLVGFSRPMKDPCGAGVSDVQCIKNLSFEEAAITSFWGDDRINRAKLALSAPYIAFMLSFGAAVGVVMHQKQK